MWSGHGLNKHRHSVFNFRQCTYNESPHLCVIMFKGHEGDPAERWSHSKIIDNTYKTVQTLSPSAAYNGRQLRQDLHEFNLLDHGQSALLTSYATVAHEVVFEHCEEKPLIKYITTGLFTETSTDGLNSTVFQWNALDHVDVLDTFVCPGQYRIRPGQTSREGTDYL